MMAIDCKAEGAALPGFPAPVALAALFNSGVNELGNTRSAPEETGTFKFAADKGEAEPVLGPTANWPVDSFVNQFEYSAFSMLRGMGPAAMLVLVE